MACFPGLVRGAGSLAGSSAVRDASWFAWSRGRWKTKAMFYGPFRVGRSSTTNFRPTPRASVERKRVSSVGFGFQPIPGRLIAARVSPVRSDRSVRLNPTWFARHAVSDHHGAETLGRRGRSGRQTAPEPAPDPKGGR